MILPFCKELRSRDIVASFEQGQQRSVYAYWQWMFRHGAPDFDTTFLKTIAYQ
jgi:hypothetical protein